MVCLTNIKLQSEPLYAQERAYDPFPEVEEECEDSDELGYVNDGNQSPQDVGGVSGVDENRTSSNRRNSNSQKSKVLNKARGRVDPPE